MLIGTAEKDLGDSAPDRFSSVYQMLQHSARPSRPVYELHGSKLTGEAKTNQYRLCIKKVATAVLPVNFAGCRSISNVFTFTVRLSSIFIINASLQIPPHRKLVAIHYLVN